MSGSRPAALGVIYARYSSTGQRDESIEGQLRDCAAYAKNHNIRIIAEYCDRAMTGTSDRRPEFQRMIRDSARGTFQVVITWKNDRFARSRYDSAIYKAKLKANGVRLLYAKETIPEGPEGIILESVMEGFAEYYSANLSQNVKRGNYDSALQRKTLGQTVYGLRKGPDGRFELDPARAPIVRRIFEEYVAGRRAKDICDRLNAEGYRTALGNPFNKNSIRNILHNEKYCGVYTYADIRDEHGIPPIVTRQMYDDAQRMLDRRHRAPAAKASDGGFLLTGKLYCGECESPMTADGGTSKTGRVYSYYICNGRRRHKCDMPRVPKDWIEDVIVRELVQLIQDDALIEVYADKYMAWQARQRRDDLPTAQERRLKEIETAIRNIVRSIEAGTASESLQTRLMDLEAEKAVLAESIARAQLRDPELSRDEIVWFLRRFRDADQSDPGWRVYLVDTFLRAAFLFADGRLILDLNFSGKAGRISLKVALSAASTGDRLSSNFAHSGAPINANLNIEIIFMDGFLLAFTFVKK